MPYHVHCPAQHCPVPFETPFEPERHGADGAGRRAGPSAAERVAGLPTGDHHEPFWLALGNMHRPCTNDSLAISSSRICSWMNCARGCAAPDRCVFLWLAIDPCTKLLPVLYLGPRTQHAAHRVIHSLRELLAPGCVPLFTSPRDTQRVSEKGENALKNWQRRQKCGYLRENSLFADVGRGGSKGSPMVQSHPTGRRKGVTESPLKNRPRRHIPCWAQCCSRHEHE